MENHAKDNEVFIEHLFNASAGRVFSAWTDPQKLAKWYAPDGCTVYFKELSVEKGGRFHCCISNPEFGDCWAVGEYIEVVPNAKIVFKLINADEDRNPINPIDIGMDADWPGSTVVTVTFAEENGKTKMQLRQTVSQEIAQRTGAYPSWLQMVNKIQAVLDENQ
ncbi:MAG: SRPBCC domain-containing protein [Cytophagaceae bacterium]|nr:MAG: SRPBCC domain-containing protein [Cytophagaceae bacterium]